ncbi:MAG TPA: hypothetical protein VF544_15775 [Pyrinomonadaceae bacterium]|jgi:hypothetical protein
MKQLQSVFCLALLLSLAGTALCQQPPPARRSRPAAANPASNSKDEEARQRRVLAVLRVHGFAERVFAFNDVSLKATTLAHLANLLWKDDEPYARQLFTRALDFYNTAVSTSDVKPRDTAWRRVVMLIARRDPAWARRLTDARLTSEGVAEGSSARLETDFNIASALAQDSPEQATEFAERSLRGGVSPFMYALLIQLRTKSEPAANALFLKTLDHLLNQPTVDADLLFRLGAYLFTSPKLEGSENPTTLAFVGLRNVGLGVPDLTADRPGVPPALVRAFLNTVTKLMLRPITDLKQRQLYYVLGYFMTPKAEKFAPDQVSLIAGAMSTLAQNVPRALTEESAYANFKSATVQPGGDRLESIENIADQGTREAAYLFYTYDLWQKGDFARARTVASRIQDLNTGAQLQTLIDFGEAARMLDKGATAVAEVEKRAARLTPGIESTMLWLGIAYASIEAGDTERAEDALRAATKAARSVEDARLPFLLLNAATQYTRVDRAQAIATLAEAVREFNAQTPEALARVNWRQRVAIDRYRHRDFNVKTRGLEFGFNASMPKLAALDIEATLAEVLKLKNEPQQSQGLMALTAALLK